jgi:cell division control protein 7
MATVRARQAGVPFEIHDEEAVIDESAPEEYLEEPMDEDDEATQDLEIDDDRFSETSEESDGIVDSSVQEDMDKFEETFQGIKDRFRLINRIGEGL